MHYNFATKQTLQLQCTKIATMVKSAKLIIVVVEIMTKFLASGSTLFLVCFWILFKYDFEKKIIKR